MNKSLKDFNVSDRGRLWDWTGKDSAGKLHRFQTNDESYAMTRDQMMLHLQGGYKNLEIVELSPATIHKPSTGRCDYHHFTNGIIDEVIAEVAQGKMRSRVLLGSLFRQPAAESEHPAPPDVLRRMPSMLKTAKSLLTPKGA